MELIENIKLAIIGHRRQRGPSCGMSIIALQQELGVSMAELRPALRSIYDEEFFTVREGLNDKLIFWIMKTKFERISFINRWLHKYGRESDWIIIGVSKWWWGWEGYCYKCCFFGLEMKLWFKRVIQ